MRLIIYCFCSCFPCFCFTQDWQAQYQEAYEKGKFNTAIAIALQQPTLTDNVLSYVLAAQAAIELENFIMAEGYLEKAKQQIRTNSSYRAKLNYTIGFLHYQKGDYKQAETFLQNALPVASTKDSIEIQLLLGNLYGSLYRYKEAKTYLERLNVEGLNRLQQIDYFYQLAIHEYLDREDLENALRYLEKANNLFSSIKGAIHPIGIKINYSVSDIYLAQNKVAVADQHFRDGAQLRAHWVNTGYYAVAQIKEASIQAQLKNKELAIKKVEQAIAWLKPTNFTKRLSYALLMKIELQLGNEEQVCSLVEEASTILSAKVARLDNNYSILLDRLGDCLVSKGAITEADTLYLESLAITAEIFGKESREYALKKFNYAFFLDVEQAAEMAAEPHYLEALAITRATFGKQHPTYLEMLFDIGSYYAYYEKHLKAIPYFQEGIYHLEEVVRTQYAQLDENSRNKYIKLLMGRIDLFRNFVCLYQPTDELILLLQQVNITLESLSLDYSRYVKQIPKNAPLKDTIAIRLYEELKEKRIELGKAYQQNAQERKDSIQELEQKIGQLERQYLLHLPPIPKQINWTFDDLKKQLTSDELLIDIFSFEEFKNNEWTKKYSYYLLVTQKDLAAPKLYKATSEQKLITLIGEKGMVPDYAKYLEQGLELTDLFFDSIFQDFPEIKTINIVSNKLMHRVAVASLPINQDGLVIGEKYTVRNFLSLRSFINLNTTPAASTTLPSIAIFAHPDFEQLPIRKDTLHRAHFGTLEGTLSEMRNIVKVFEASNWRIDTFTQMEASETNLKALSSKSPTILHVATHGYFFKRNFEKDSILTYGDYISTHDNPLMHTGLVLSGGDASWNKAHKGINGEDGVITAYEIELLDLSTTKLIVLSACHTGMGDILNSLEGAYGLPKALKVAGVEKLLTSLWAIPDDITAELMTYFYEYYTSGQEAHLALANAQRKMMAQNFHPKDWGAFILLE